MQTPCKQLPFSGGNRVLAGTVLTGENPLCNWEVYGAQVSYDAAELAIRAVTARGNTPASNFR